jgi:hypothetical protein
MASIPIPKVASSDKLTSTTQGRTSTPPARKETGGQPNQGDLKEDDQGRPRTPTPFQEIPGSSREGSTTNNPEETRVTQSPDGLAKPDEEQAG